MSPHRRLGQLHAVRACDGGPALLLLRLRRAVDEAPEELETRVLHGRPAGVQAQQGLRQGHAAGLDDAVGDVLDPAALVGAALLHPLTEHQRPDDLQHRALGDELVAGHVPDHAHQKQARVSLHHPIPWECIDGGLCQLLATCIIDELVVFMVYVTSAVDQTPEQLQTRHLHPRCPRMGTYCSCGQVDPPSSNNLVTSAHQH
mmetsp:Transcript_128245/g.362935  ORF Transcript_128245/g.362935 Transcript_128245/m.362935 type:complete len:202 (+) Transcript_128245:295-900(+)